MPQRVDAVVIGAGFAGLGAARSLADQGTSVIVIEARERIGGRAWTSDLWPDLPLDMGASWIHGIKGNPLTLLAEKVGVQPFPTSYDRTLAFAANGASIDFEEVAEDAEHILKAARDAIEDNEKDMSLKQAVLRAPEWRNLSADRQRLIRLAIHTRVEHEYSGDWARLSAWYFDDGEDFPGTDAVMPLGFGPLAAHLAQGLDIRFDEPVLQIDPIDDGVRVTTTTGTHTASRAIVTLPLGVLKSGDIAFGAPLREKRQKAIDRLEMGLLNKCWLRFETAFWPEGVDWFDHLGDWNGEDPEYFPEFTNFLKPTGIPLLVGFNATATGEKLEQLDDYATVAAAMVTLRSIFGNAIPDPIAYQISRWRQDRFAQGSYSFQPVGTKAKTRKGLFGTDWQGRLLFAGEATSHDHPGTVHGALMTGRAVADMA